VVTDTSTFALVGSIIAIALVFDYTNGFHDAANAIATAVGSKALSPRVALAIAALGNLAGAFISTSVAGTVGSGIIAPPSGTSGLLVVLAGLVGAIAWNLITWWFGLPSSSSHALIGGLAGAMMASIPSAAFGGTTVLWTGILAKVVIPMILSPIIGFSLAYLLALAILWLFRNAKRDRATPGFKLGQALASGVMALGHGLQDAQKTMGVITLALIVGGVQAQPEVIDGVTQAPEIQTWVKISAALAISLGTWAGGWRIMATLGRKVTQMDLPRGFAAQTVASTVLYVMAIKFAAPISTTHTITSSILGAGATRGRKHVKWGVVQTILGAWILTFPAAALIAATTHFILAGIFNFV
jgi:PiT family inorganic phosphate transporter